MQLSSWLLGSAICLAACAACATLPACSSSDAPAADAPAPPPPVPAAANGVDAGPSGNPFDVPIDDATAAERQVFFAGDALFELPLRDADGLGPLYTRTSCGACHDGGRRAVPALVQKMVGGRAPTA